MKAFIKAWQLMRREITPLESAARELMDTEHYLLDARSRMEDAVATVTCYEKRIARLRAYVNEETTK